ncbi:GNAT family N-acetyltransferase [Streptomyces sp. NPDC020883]|uniref:GNAT family N-acetyltransferase n=1 Tax=Streptomyces sp. NPDC020883 TaxID=3365099 RepID=UPI0037AF251A
MDGQQARTFLGHQWQNLYDHDPAATPYQSAAWLNGWAAQLLHPATPLVLLVTTAQGHPLAALALIRETNAHGRVRVRPLGSPSAEYIRLVGPASSHPAVAAAMARRLRAMADDGVCVVLPDLPLSTRLGQIMHEQQGWQHTEVSCAQITLPVPYKDMSSSTRRDHTRRERIWTALEGKGRVEYRITHTDDELGAAYSDAQLLHWRRWAGNPAQPDTDQAGLLNVLRRCGTAEAFVATLTLDQTLAATVLCFRRGSTCYSFLPAMEPGLAELAPGHALIRRLASDLTQRGYHTLDLGRTRPDPNQVRYKDSYLPKWTVTVTATSRGY